MVLKRIVSLFQSEVSAVADLIGAETQYYVRLSGVSVHQRVAGILRLSTLAFHLNERAQFV
jgi:hypothetical protein